jgi:hypothetical protein
LYHLSSTSAGLYLLGISIGLYFIEYFLIISFNEGAKIEKLLR